MLVSSMTSAMQTGSSTLELSSKSFPLNYVKPPVHMLEHNTASANYILLLWKMITDATKLKSLISRCPYINYDPSVICHCLVPRPSPAPVLIACHMQKCFCILQVVKNWSQRRSGNEATSVSLAITSVWCQMLMTVSRTFTTATPSLIPKPSRCSVFDCLQYKIRGRPGPFYHMDDVNVYVRREGGRGKEGGSRNERTSFTHAFCFCPEHWLRLSSKDSVLQKQQKSISSHEWRRSFHSSARVPNANIL